MRREQCYEQVKKRTSLGWNIRSSWRQEGSCSGRQRGAHAKALLPERAGNMWLMALSAHDQGTRQGSELQGWGLVGPCRDAWFRQGMIWSFHLPSRSFFQMVTEAALWGVHREGMGPWEWKRLQSSLFVSLTSGHLQPLSSRTLFDTRQPGATQSHQLPLWPASLWCPSSARTGGAQLPFPPPLAETLSLSVIRNELSSGHGGPGRSQRLCVEAFAGCPIAGHLSLLRVTPILHHQPHLKRMFNCQLTFSADTESPVPFGEGRDQLSLLRISGSFSFLILAPID